MLLHMFAMQYRVKTLFVHATCNVQRLLVVHKRHIICHGLKYFIACTPFKKFDTCSISPWKGNRLVGLLDGWIDG